MAHFRELRVLVVGDDARERARALRLCQAPWQGQDGGPPAAEIARAVQERFDAVMYTGCTDSIDLGTWHQALRLSGFDGLVFDARLSGRRPADVLSVERGVPLPVRQGWISPVANAG